jgi:hypothetical protein
MQCKHAGFEMSHVFGMAFLVVFSGIVTANEPGPDVAKRIVQSQTGENRLTRDAWGPFESGFQRAGDLLECDNGGDLKARRGAVQTVALQQSKPEPIVATAWSRAEGVAGSPDGDYSIYLDLAYVDGTHLWGQSALFATGTHDWQRRRVVVVPEKPIKTVSYYLLFRNRGGKVWFRDPQLCTVRTAAGAALFDGLAVEAVGDSREGFQIRDAAAGGDFLRVDEKPLPADSSKTGESGSLLNKGAGSEPAGSHDAKNGRREAPVPLFQQTASSFGGQALGLDLTWRVTKTGDATFFDLTLKNGSPAKDRAVTLLYATPISGGSIQWLCGPRSSVPVQPGHEYGDSQVIHAGNGRLSRYPLAAVGDGGHGTALGIDMMRPTIFRVAYNHGTRELYLAYDIGLTAEKPEAKISFCRFAFDAAWGFRSALARYYALFPEPFRCRVARQGNWMPFAPISKVRDWQDFGFRFKEGNDETKWDDEHGILTFRYSEPMTWWMSMPKETPRTLDAALAEAKRLAEQGDMNAKALFASGMCDAFGRLAARLLDTPWCNGAVWSMNSMPGITAPGIPGDATDFKNKWNGHIRDGLYGPKRAGALDGEYIDSSEGYVTEELDFCRKHFAAANTPLTFSQDEHRPAIYRGLVAFEYARGLAVDVHGMGKLMMANATPYQLCWLAPLLDVMGTETDWNPGAGWQPMSDAELFYRRALCKGKPYCLLMNTQFDRLPSELVEKYMKRSLAYGMFPGFFSADASTGHYFSRPEMYDRDRPLFKKYVPLCKRVAEAGWEPITAAWSNDEHIRIERFGTRYLTVFNESPDRRTAVISLESKSPPSSRELVSGKTIAWTNGKATMTLGGEDVAVVELP